MRKFSWIEFKYWNWIKPRERFIQWIAFKVLPREVAYWAAIRVIASATVGKYKHQIVPDLTAMQVLERWEK